MAMCVNVRQCAAVYGILHKTVQDCHTICISFSPTYVLAVIKHHDSRGDLKVIHATFLSLSMSIASRVAFC